MTHQPCIPPKKPRRGLSGTVFFITVVIAVFDIAACSLAQGAAPSDRSIHWRGSYPTLFALYEHRRNAPGSSPMFDGIVQVNYVDGSGGHFLVHQASCTAFVYCEPTVGNALRLLPPGQQIRLRGISLPSGKGLTFTRYQLLTHADSSECLYGQHQSWRDAIRVFNVEATELAEIAAANSKGTLNPWIPTSKEPWRSTVEADDRDLAIDAAAALPTDISITGWPQSFACDMRSTYWKNGREPPYWEPQVTRAEKSVTEALDPSHGIVCLLPKLTGCDAPMAEHGKQAIRRISFINVDRTWPQGNEAANGVCSSRNESRCSTLIARNPQAPTVDEGHLSAEVPPTAVTPSNARTDHILFASATMLAFILGLLAARTSLRSHFNRRKLGSLKVLGAVEAENSTCSRGNPDVEQSGIIHDINNVLNVAQTTLASISVKSLEPEVTRLATTAKSALEQAGRLTRALANLSSMQKAHDLSTRLDIRPLLTSVATQASDWMPSNIKIEYQLSDQPQVILSDAVSMERLLLNLLVNSRDAIGNRSGKIRIRSRSVQSVQGRGFLRISVADSGCGMCRELTKYIFEPFFSTKNSNSPRGLGLWAVKKTVDDHGGQIRVWSQLNRGTCIQIMIPLASVPECLPATNTAHLLGMRVGLIQGSTLLRDERETFESLGCEVETLNDQELSAAITSTDRSFDLIVIPIQLPALDGLDCFELVKRANPEQQVAFYTPHQTALKKLADKLGSPAPLILSKPLSRSDLAVALSSSRDVDLALL